MTDYMIGRLCLGVIATCLVLLAVTGPEPATDDHYGESTTYVEAAP